DRGIARAFELGAPQGALGRKGHKAHEPQFIAVVLPNKLPFLFRGRELLRHPVGPLVEFGQPILAERCDLVAGQDKDADLRLSPLERDHGPLALRLVGRARLAAAPTFTRLSSASRHWLFLATFCKQILICLRIYRKALAKVAIHRPLCIATWRQTPIAAASLTRRPGPAGGPRCSPAGQAPGDAAQ